MNRKGRSFIVVLLGLAAMAVLAVGAELAYRQRLAKRRFHVADLQYYKHARMERAFVRGVDYGNAVHINRFGFRGPEFDFAKPPGTTRVIVFGASTTFDPCVGNDAEAWPARMEFWLNRQSRDGRFQVINAGVPGFPMTDQVIRLHTEIYRFAPDVLVLYANHGIVTAADAAVPLAGGPTPDEARAPSPFQTWMRRHSRLFTRINPEKRAVVSAAPYDREAAAQNASNEFRRNLMGFALIGRTIGAKVFFVEINSVTGDRDVQELTAAERATWERLFNTRPELVHEDYARFERDWRSAALATGASYIDADSLHIVGPQFYCENDPIHFNKQGSEAMGQRMAQALLRDALATQ